MEKDAVREYECGIWAMRNTLWQNILWIIGKGAFSDDIL